MEISKKFEVDPEFWEKYNEAWIWRLLAMPYHYIYHRQMLEHLKGVREKNYARLRFKIFQKFSEAINGQKNIANRSVSVPKTKKEEVHTTSSK